MAFLDVVRSALPRNPQTRLVGLCNPQSPLYARTNPARNLANHCPDWLFRFLLAGPLKTRIYTVFDGFS